MIFIVTAILLYIAASVGIQKWKKYDAERVKRLGLWYLKGIVYEGGSVTEILRRDTLLLSMMIRGKNRGGIDADAANKEIVERRIEKTKELIEQAEIYIRKQAKCQPTSQKIDQVLINMLGPTKEKLYQETSKEMKESGLTKMMTDYEVSELGEVGQSIYLHYINKIFVDELDEAKASTRRILLFDMVKNFRILSDNLEIDKAEAQLKKIIKEFGSDS